MKGRSGVGVHEQQQPLNRRGGVVTTRHEEGTGMLRCPSFRSVLRQTLLSITIANGATRLAAGSCPNNIMCCGPQALSPLVPRRSEVLVREAESKLTVCSASSKRPCPLSRPWKKFSSTTSLPSILIVTFSTYSDPASDVSLVRATNQSLWRASYGPAVHTLTADPFRRPQRPVTNSRAGRLLL